MKKMIALTALFLFVATSAFAASSITLSMTSNGLNVFGAKGTMNGGVAATATGSTPGASTSLIGKCSTGVGVGMVVDPAGTAYSVVTQHKNGSKVYGTSYDSTSIYSKDITTVGTADTTSMATSSSMFTAAGWTTM